MYTLGYSGFTRDSRLATGGRSPFAKTNLEFNNLFAFRDGEVPFSMFPLGYLGHDASAALVQDDHLIACAAEERFIRAKHSLNLAGNTLLPSHAIDYCLDTAGISIDEVDVVAHYCSFRRPTITKRLHLLRPFLSLDDTAKVEESYQCVFKAMMEHQVVLDHFERIAGARPKAFVPVCHHEAHAASAFFPSGFDQALILTIDGAGELESSLLAVGKGKTITEIQRTLLPTSLGSLYLIITVFLGFRSLGDEYKVMGLAAYGNRRRFRDFFRSLVILEKDGQYATPCLARKGFRELLIEQLGPPRRADEPIQEIHADIAAALQEVLEETVLHTLKHARAETGIPRLCLAGGVALNCQLNGAIARSRLFREIFVQPASSDEGCSVGAALYAYFNNREPLPNSKTAWEHAYLGPEYDSEEMRQALANHEAKLHWTQKEDIAVTVAEELTRGKVVGWYQGRMEFGPRALGNRSILADPRTPDMKDRINAKVKHREAFRPFAPAVLEEEAAAYFDLLGLSNSPFMLFAVPVRQPQRSRIPATTHIDGTARVQTVSKKTNPLFWELIAEFKKLTGVPVILNTSFNVRNEPIVCTPRDAIRCFLSTEIDCLAMGKFFVEKREIE
jgi:carbamoyltransferase